MLGQRGALAKSLVVCSILLFVLLVSFTGAVSCSEEQKKYTSELQIVSHSMSYDEYGGAIVEGIAKNGSASEVAELEVRVKFYDVEGNLIGAHSDYIKYVGPSETCKFKIRTGLHAESYEIAIFQTRSQEEGKHAPELQIVSHSISHDEYGNSIVQGIAKNTGASEIAELKVSVKFYDAEGNLVDSSADYIQYVEPNESCKFSVRGLPAESYKVTIFKTR